MIRGICLSTIFFSGIASAAEGKLAAFYDRILEAHSEPAKYDEIAATVPDPFQLVPAE